jgi:hypothetical protein
MFVLLLKFSFLVQEDPYVLMLSFTCLYSVQYVCVVSRIARDGAGASFLQEGQSGNSMGLDRIHTSVSTTHYLK